MWCRSLTYDIAKMFHYKMRAYSVCVWTPKNAYAKGANNRFWSGFIILKIVMKSLWKHVHAFVSIMVCTCFIRDNLGMCVDIYKRKHLHAKSYQLANDIVCIMRRILWHKAQCFALTFTQKFQKCDFNRCIMVREI